MGFLQESTLGKYVANIRNSPRELILNKSLLCTAAGYAWSGFAISFSQAFGITSATNPTEISNFVSFVYIGAGVGAGLSFFLNDRLGRLWSMRLYMAIYIIGQLIATVSSGNTGALYTARIVSGLGIGPLTVIGPMTLVEVAPTEIRGLIAVWFSVVMLLSLFLSTMTVYGVFLHIPAGPLQYQIIFFVPMLVMAVAIGLSFFCMHESPRWLFLTGDNEAAVRSLVALRGLPADHPRVAGEIIDVEEDIKHSGGAGKGGLPFKTVVRETFLVPANLRRVQQAFISYALAQLSGANSVTSYLVPILSLMGIGGGTTQSLFLSSMYSLAKFFYTLIASFFFIDMLGRRKSLFIGIITQMLSDVYIGVYIRQHTYATVTPAASSAAVAAIFIHGFGYAVGLLVLPYVFTGELWPNHLRSFGSAISQCFHWLFYFGVNKGTPSMLTSMDNWGAFIFFAGWCFVAVVYIFLAVPETTGLSLESTNALFEGPWWEIHSKSRRFQKERRVAGAAAAPVVLDSEAASSKDADVEAGEDGITTKAGDTRGSATSETRSV
ncbi:uncharacterized protein B0I36DRAFT_397968 [Microdochium trichocladiopsis]|uniref:Major facilitator superfamily (MFS) profile domain-containing protein n=1 Tax=Microdochium trichocladiopsis TaxID=1682393 RepID=A0A9P8XV69_9PEZI|nr:uncharacterized protein B0I36DRAFT_397968 [Microdochium trichocladiopsis]KAH7014397.1 hypothetical protein B0I36DRAFT_397968 [Microdochium trichocladiopsis]